MTRGIDYKQHCIEESIHLIDFLNENFNLFSFDEGLVVSPAYDNLVMIERMSRIIPYIYEHHEEKITLEDLAEIEHLSTYYISHMMKDCLGLNFREFLSFSRVEFSEMMLLQTDEKIRYLSHAASGSGQRLIMESFFCAWLGRLPAEHREPLRFFLQKSDAAGKAWHWQQQCRSLHGAAAAFCGAKPPHGESCPPAKAVRADLCNRTNTC